MYFKLSKQNLKKYKKSLLIFEDIRSLAVGANLCKVQSFITFKIYFQIYKPIIENIKLTTVNTVNIVKASDTRYLAKIKWKQQFAEK